MSFDRRLEVVCPHEVVEEALFLSSDHRTIRPLRPISSVNSVKVRLNGEVIVPSYGHQLPAEVTTTKFGVFTINPGANTLIYQLDNDPDRTITVQPGSNLTAKQIAKDLTLGAVGVTFGVTTKQAIHLKTKKLGRLATLMFKESPLATTLGLAINRQFRGRAAVPGWSLINDPTTLLDRPTRFIVFDTPLRGFRDFVEVTYTTLQQECRRCGGLGVEHDWRYDQNGDVVEARNFDLLIQEIEKICFTVLGSNPFFSWYGTKIVNTIGSKITSGGVVQNLIASDISEAIRRWQSIKRQQEAIGQLVTDEEFPLRLLEVKLQPSNDPTVVFVEVTIQSRSDKPIQIERGFRVVPEARS